MLGGGVCVSTSLTERDRAALEHPGAGVSSATCEAVGILALFDGIGGFRRPLDLLGVSPGAFFASEIDKAAMRCVAAAYPQVVHLGDVTLLGVDTWRRMTTEHPWVRIWFVPAGFPCQDLSSLNKVARKGLGGDRSSLYLEVVRLVKEGR